MQLLRPAPSTALPTGSAAAGSGAMDQLRHGRRRAAEARASAPAGWAALLVAWATSAGGQERRTDPDPPASEDSWVGRLKAHALRAGWSRTEPAWAMVPPVDPALGFAAVLHRLRVRLDHECRRADAAEQGRQAAVAAAEQRLQALLARHEEKAAAAGARIIALDGQLAGALQRAGLAETAARVAQAEIRRLRSRGFWARIVNAG